MAIDLTPYSVQGQRLALGITFVDLLGHREPRQALRVEIERQVPHLTPLPADSYGFMQQGNRPPVALTRHGSGRYSLCYHAGMGAALDLRIYDRSAQLLPRRVRVPLQSLAEVLAIEAAQPLDYFSARVRRIALFPDSAYHLNGGESGLRGRVLRAGQPMRWAFVEARSPVTNAVVMRTRTNRHGEFLLVLPPQATPASDLSARFALRVSVAGPVLAPVPASAALPEQDALWDLPLEQLPAPGVPDTVASGEDLPAGYVTALSATRTVNFASGRLLTGRDESAFDFVFP